MVPSFYTEREGGPWLPWPDGPVSPRLLRNPPGFNYQLTGDLKIHALMFGPIDHERYFEKRWDVISGWSREAMENA